MIRRAATLSLLLICCSCPGEQDGPSPNVLFVVMDTVRADHCSVYGYPRATTPNLVALARESTAYTDAWSPAGWTAPAHASMFTGLRPEHHGLNLGNRLFLPETSSTLAENLAAAGYHTYGASGSPVVSPTFGLVQGFQGFDLVMEEDGHEPEEIYRLALVEIRRATAEGRPFFVFLNDFRAHLTYIPSAESRQAFLPPDATPEEVEAGMAYGQPAAVRQIAESGPPPSPREIEILTALYDGEIRDVDSSLGKFLDVLRADGTLDQTLVIVTSDHGENLGDHGMMSHILSLHRSVRRVPLLIRHPGHFESGARVSATVRLEDLFPTVLEVCGLEVPEGLDGTSLRGVEGGRLSRAIHGPFKLAAGAAGAGHVPAPGASGPYSGSLKAVFDGQLHLIAGSDGKEELYDVRADPAEEVNRSSGGVPETLRGELP